MGNVEQYELFSNGAKLPTELSTVIPDEFIVCFWAYVGKRDPFTGCLEWQGPYDQVTGRPVMRFKGAFVDAVALALIDAGIKPPWSEATMERCSNTRCVDPSHVRFDYIPEDETD